MKSKKSFFSYSQDDSISEGDKFSYEYKPTLIYSSEKEIIGDKFVQRIKFWEKNYNSMGLDFQKINNIAGFYGTKKEVGSTIKKWIGQNLCLQDQKEGSCSIYFFQEGKSLAVILLSDDNIFKQVFNENCLVIHLIKIMQDIASIIYLCACDSFEIDEKITQQNIREKTEAKDLLQKFLVKSKKQFKVQYKKVDINKEHIQCDLQKQNEMDNLAISEFYKEDFDNFQFINDDILFVKARNNHDYQLKQIVKSVDLAQKNFFESTIFENTKQQYITIFEYLLYLENSMNLLQQEKTQQQIKDQILQEISVFLKIQVEYTQLLKIVDEVLIKVQETKKLDKKTKLLHFDLFLKKTEEDYEDNLWQRQNNCIVQLQLFKIDITKNQEQVLTLQQQGSDSFSFSIQKLNQNKIIVKKFLKYSKNFCFLSLFCDQQNITLIYKVMIQQNKKIYVEHFQDFDASVLICFDQYNKNMFVLNQNQYELLLYKIEDNGKIFQTERMHIVLDEKIVDFIYQSNQQEFLFILEDKKIYRISLFDIQNSICNQDDTLYDIEKISNIQKEIFKKLKPQEEFLKIEKKQHTEPRHYKNFVHLNFQGYFCVQHQQGMELYDDNYNIVNNFKTNSFLKNIQFFFNKKQLYFIIQDQKKLYLSLLSEFEQEVQPLLENQSQMQNFIIIDYFLSAVLLYGRSQYQQDSGQNQPFLICREEIYSQIQQYINENNYNQYIQIYTQHKIQRCKDTNLFQFKNFDIDFMLKHRIPIQATIIHKDTLLLLHDQKIIQNDFLRSQIFMFKNCPQIKISFQKQISDIINYINFGIHENIQEDKPIITILNIQDPFIEERFKTSHFIFGTLFQTVFNNQQQGLQLSICKKKDVFYILMNFNMSLDNQYLSQKGLYLLFHLIKLSNITLYDCNCYQSKFSQNIFQLLLKFYNTCQQEHNTFRALRIFSQNFQNFETQTEKQNVYDFGELQDIFVDIKIRFFSFIDFDTSLRFFIEEINYCAQEILSKGDQNTKNKQLQHGQSQIQSFELKESPTLQMKPIVSDKSIIKIEKQVQQIFPFSSIFKKIIKQKKNQCRIKTLKNVKTNLSLFFYMLKIIFGQVIFGDDSDNSILAIKIELHNVYQNFLKFFMQFRGNFANTRTLINVKNFQEKTILVEQDELVFYRLVFINYKSPFKKGHYLNQDYYIQFLKIFNTEVAYSIEKHDQWIESFYDFCLRVIQQRIQICKENFESQFESENEFNEEVKQMAEQLEEKLSQVLKNYKMCNYRDSQRCLNCSRKCIMSENHTGLCNCYTGHQCIQTCDTYGCACRQQDFCQQQYGHSGQNHKCPNEQTQCQSKCSINQCQRQCQKDNSIQHQDHNCQMNHLCQSKCSLSQCQEACVLFLEEIHENHQCQNQKCPIKCKFCDNTCNFNDHFHDHNISIQVQVDYSQELNQENYRQMNHYCGCKCECQQECEHDGVCKVIYKLRDNDNVFEQIPLKDKCSVMIYPFNRVHQGKHLCSNTHQKRCEAKCPQCRIMCSKPYGHEGLHFNLLHQQRNDFIFSEIEKEKFLNVDSGCFIFSTYQNLSRKKNCIENCQNMRKNDIHLVTCLSPKSCKFKQSELEQAMHFLQQEQAIHSLQQEKPRVDIIKCPYFFQVNRWEKPKKIQIIND